MNAVMISVAGREESRATTLRNAEEHGVNVLRVFTRDDMPRGVPNVTENGRDAITWAYGQGFDHILFMEDDVEFSSKFQSYISGVLDECDYAVTLYTPGNRFYPSRLLRHVKAKRPIQFEVCDAVDVKRYFGSQAVIFSRRGLAAMLDGWTCLSVDLRIAEICAGHPGRLRMAVPNLVRHAGSALKSTWSPYGKPHDSNSYIP